MPHKITFSKKEEDELKEAIYLWKVDEGSANYYPPKHLESLLAKMEAARDKPKGFQGVSIKWVIDSARATLGSKLSTPQNQTGAWYAKMQRALNDNGITQDIAQKAIEFVAKNWDNVWIETLVYSMAKIAAGGMPSSGKSSKKTGFTPTKKSGWLAQLEDEDK